MSWDIFVQDIPEEARSTSDIPDGFVPTSIGTRAEIREAIRRVVPGADFSDPEWGRIEGDGYAIEVNLGEGDPCMGFALHVRGGELAACVVHDILEELELRAFDTGSETGLFSLAGGALEGLAEWRRYRDRVLRDGGDERPVRRRWKLFGALAVAALTAWAVSADDLSRQEAEAVREHVRAIEAGRDIMCGTLTSWHAEAIDQYGEAGWALAEREMEDPESARHLRSCLKRQTE